MIRVRFYCAGLAGLFLRLGVVCVVASVLAFAFEAKAVSVVNFTMASKGNGSRIVVEISDKREFSIRALSESSRLIIDFADTGWSISDPQTKLSNLIADYRFGKYRDGRLRMIFDISEGFNINKYGTLARSRGRRGIRLWIDITKADPGAKTRQDQFTSKGWSAWETKAREHKFQLRENDDGRRVVVLDPGHGGFDPGAVSGGKVREKDLVMKAAHTIKKHLEQQGITVYLTREKDVFVPLRDRFYIAESLAADIFISLHADKYADKGVKGVTIYTLSSVASEKESALLAISENKSDIIAGHSLDDYSQDVSRILIGLAQKHTNRKSVALARFLEDGLGGLVLMRRDAHKVADFAVLKSPNVPSILVELGFMSNQRDIDLLITQAFREKVARGVARSLSSYFESEVKGLAY